MNPDGIMLMQGEMKYMEKQPQTNKLMKGEKGKTNKQKT